MPVTMKKGMENRPLSMVGPRGTPRIASDEQPLGIRRGERLAEHHRQEQGEKARGGGAVEGIEIFRRHCGEHRFYSARFPKPHEQKQRHTASEQYKL